MDNKNFSDAYDDGNIPEADLPRHNSKNANASDNFTPLSDFLTSAKITNKNNSDGIVEPLPESSRPRQDGPGGN